MKSKRGSSGTEADLEKLQVLAKKKLSARLAAGDLGSSNCAIKYKAMVEGIRFQNVRVSASAIAAWMLSIPECAFAGRGRAA